MEFKYNLLLCEHSHVGFWIGNDSWIISQIFCVILDFFRNVTFMIVMFSESQNISDRSPVVQAKALGVKPACIWNVVYMYVV